MMKASEFEVFVDSVTNYFSIITKIEAEVGTPFLIQNVNKYLFDYTGIIGVSGEYKGAIFFTAPRIMMVKLISQIGIPTTREDKLLDLVGEVSNILVGNARRLFGSQFLLSSPIKLQGSNIKIDASEVAEILVAPIVWRNLKAHLIINIYDTN